MAAIICSTMRGAKPSEGSSSSSSDGLPISVRAIASICCSPPDMRAPGPMTQLRQIGKDREQLFRRPERRAGARRAAADAEVFRDRQVGEDAPVLRHIAETQTDDGVGRQSQTGRGRRRRLRRSARATGRGSRGTSSTCRRRCGRSAPPPRRARLRARRRTARGRARKRREVAHAKAGAHREPPSSAPAPR